MGDGYKELEHSTQFFSQIAKDCSCTMYIQMKVAIVWHNDCEAIDGMTFKKIESDTEQLVAHELMKQRRNTRQGV